MLRLFAISVLAVRDVEIKGAPKIATSHCAKSALIDGRADINRVALTIAKRNIFPEREGYYDHTISVEEISYTDVICPCVEHNERESAPTSSGSARNDYSDMPRKQQRRR